MYVPRIHPLQWATPIAGGWVPVPTSVEKKLQSKDAPKSLVANAEPIAMPPAPTASRYFQQENDVTFRTGIDSSDTDSSMHSVRMETRVVWCWRSRLVSLLAISRRCPRRDSSRPPATPARISPSSLHQKCVQYYPHHAQSVAAYPMVSVP